jgi:nicotinamidase-related amidase
LLVIDVTESFVGPDLPVPKAQETSRQACGEHAWRALPQIEIAIERFRRAGRPVIFTVPDTNQRWLGAATRGEVGGPVDGRVAHTVTPTEDEAVIVKAKASAFFGTALVSGLIKHGVDTLVLTGGTTSGCVRATAVDATSLGFEVFVGEDAVFDRVQLSHLVALSDIDAKYGRVHPTSEVLERLGLSD